MFSIQKFFSQDNQFFDLLEKSANEALELTRLLIELLKNRRHSQPLDDFAKARGHDKLITEEIRKQLVNTFVTGLEREDIEMVAYAIYRTCKTIEKFAERFNIAPQRMEGVDFSKQTILIERAMTTMAEMIQQLRKMPSLETIKGLNDNMQSIETEADEVIIELLTGIYGGKYEPIQAMMVRDLHDLLEKVIDRCRDAANAVTHIVMKNS
jgi:uncharacterized protein Yka (UPF0111/DUF47 family)